MPFLLWALQTRKGQSTHWRSRGQLSGGGGLWSGRVRRRKSDMGPGWHMARVAFAKSPKDKERPSSEALGGGEGRLGRIYGAIPKGERGDKKRRKFSAVPKDVLRSLRKEGSVTLRTARHGFKRDEASSVIGLSRERPGRVHEVRKETRESVSRRCFYSASYHLFMSHFGRERLLGLQQKGRRGRRLSRRTARATAEIVKGGYLSGYQRREGGQSSINPGEEKESP
uniref:Uncharacterized protein n=1 Tax=Steinernema glaseri TaxID=37863 RepID=A0A1I8AU91_9BILA